MALDSSTVIGFELRGQAGIVRVRYGVNDDPARWGYPLLDLDPLIEVSRGFPIVETEVEYEAEGYAAIMAWIQILRIHDLDTDERTTVVDRPPQLADLDLPYVTFGPRPTLFDAPSTNAGRNRNWDARATLVASPDCVMTRRVQPLCGFGWGYRLRDGQPQLADLYELDDSAWHEDAALLSEQHPSWTFEHNDGLPTS